MFAPLLMLTMFAPLAAGFEVAQAATWKQTTLYAIRPLPLVDITDRDSADAAGDIFFWVKDHVVKPMHCRVDPDWHQCNETGVIDHDVVYQAFEVSYDPSRVGPYASCNPDGPNSTWQCVCHGAPAEDCQGLGMANISDHIHPQFRGDPSPALAQKFTPGVWVSTSHLTECGNPHRNASTPCTWKKTNGKIVRAECLNGNVISVVKEASGGAIERCEKAEGKQCDYLKAAVTGLSDCCINAFIAGINATTREALIAPVAAAFASDNTTAAGCKAVNPPSTN
jgi:hypothetical protein